MVISFYVENIFINLWSTSSIQVQITINSIYQECDYIQYCVELTPRYNPTIPSPPLSHYLPLNFQYTMPMAECTMSQCQQLGTRGTDGRIRGLAGMSILFCANVC